MAKIVGIDEVGRGPLAGPVTVCVVACETSIYKELCRLKALPPLGKDSKKLTHVDRVRYSKVLKDLANRGKISFKIVNQTNALIDSRGISFCIKKSIETGLKKLQIKSDSDVRLDGGLKAPKVFTKQRTIIKGDEKEKIIAWASILAKVSRDSFMTLSAKKFSQYGFDLHKGYGTAYHRKMIKKCGFSSMHRQSFCRNLKELTSL